MFFVCVFICVFWGVTFFPNFNRTLGKQTVNERRSWSNTASGSALIWVCTVCLCPINWTLGTYGFLIHFFMMSKVNDASINYSYAAIHVRSNYFKFNSNSNKVPISFVRDTRLQPIKRCQHTHFEPPGWLERPHLLWQNEPNNYCSL